MEERQRTKGADEMFCQTCGAIIKRKAVVCVKCSVPVRGSVGAVASKDKKTAVLLAVFLGLWTWCYTYKKDAWKFWLNLGLFVVTLGIWGIVAWIWAIIDAARRPAEFYIEFDQAATGRSTLFSVTTMPATDPEGVVQVAEVRMWEVDPRRSTLSPILQTGASDSGRLEYDGHRLSFRGKKKQIDMTSVNSVSMVRSRFSLISLFVLWLCYSVFFLIVLTGISGMQPAGALLFALITSLAFWFWQTAFVSKWVRIAYRTSPEHVDTIYLFVPRRSGGSQRLYQTLVGLGYGTSAIGSENAPAVAEPRTDRPDVPLHGDEVDDAAPIPADEVASLASSPPKSQLFAQLLGTLQSPAAGVLAVLSGPSRSLLNLLQLHAEQLETAAPGKGSEVKAVATPMSDKRVVARDNLGTRLDTFDKARIYWINWMQTAKIPPFVCYKFETASECIKALSGLSFIAQASDTGELISSEPVYYGHYEIDPGKYEVLICGEALTVEMFREAMEELGRAGGVLKDKKEATEKSTGGQGNTDSGWRVRVTFDVTLPDSTPDGQPIHLAGNFNDWNAAGTPLVRQTRSDPSGKTRAHAVATVTGRLSERLEYKYTRGTWETVEKGRHGEELPNRIVAIPPAPADEITIEDAVEGWSDRPAVEKKVGGGVRPPASAVSVSFQRKESKGPYTYHIYRAPDKEAAIAFLKTVQPPTVHNVYHIVETPEGKWGKDIDGVYEEH